MNNFEFWSMNNPIRGMIQEFIEVKRLRELSDLPINKTVLEIGCGNGHGTRLIKKYFQPKSITAIDLDTRMIAIAKRKNKDSDISFEVGDAASLPYKSATFDAIFDFGIIHHIPNWKDCLKELCRVLRPGGELIIEDLSIETFKTPIGSILKKVLDHPYKAMYEKEEFLSYLKTLGFKLKATEGHYPLASIKYFIVIAVK